MQKTLKLIRQRKIAAGLIALTVIFIAYFGYQSIFGNDGASRYVFAEVKKGTLVVSLSGSGQVSAANQVDVKPKVSGETVYVGVKNGQTVQAGTLIAQLDTRDAQKAVRDAEVNLASAQLALEKLQTPTSQQAAADQLNKTLEDGLTEASRVYTDLSPILPALENVFFDNNLGGPDSGTKNNIEYYADVADGYDPSFASVPQRLSADYQKIKLLYEQAFAAYKDAGRGGEPQKSKQAIIATKDFVQKTAGVVKQGKDLIQFFKDKSVADHWQPDKPEVVDQQLIDLNGYNATVNSHLTSLLSAVSSINDAESRLTADQLDVRSQELTLRQRENALADAREKLADYFVRAPFDGVIAKVNAKKGDSASAGTAVATFITKQKIAEISLNEIDVAQVKIGQKTTLTFDAVPNLTVTGQVAEVDAVGTVSQGVVTYTVKIGFDTQDDRVKTAMSVSAAIVTEAKPNALLVPNSAVKSQGGMSYVEIAEGEDLNAALAASVSGVILKNSPRRRPVEIGAANDEFTEIISGLNEGDVVVTRTIQSTTQSTQTQRNSAIRIPGFPGGGMR